MAVGTDDQQSLLAVVVILDQTDRVRPCMFDVPVSDAVLPSAVSDVHDCQLYVYAANLSTVDLQLRRHGRYFAGRHEPPLRVTSGRGLTFMLHGESSGVGPSSNPRMRVEHGLYELLLTATLERELEPLGADAVELNGIDPADQPHVLARHVAQVVESTLAGISDQGQRLDLVIRLLETIDATGEYPIPPARQLFAVPEPTGP